MTMLNFYYIILFLLCSTFLFNLLVCLSTKLMPFNGFFRLAKVNDISYSIFNYCITSNNTDVCSNSKVGYDNTLFLYMKQPQYLNLLFNEIIEIDVQILKNAIKLGEVELIADGGTSISLESLIELSSAYNLYSFSKYKPFLQVPANNGFSGALIFHVLNCVFCGLVIIALVSLRQTFSKHEYVLFKHKPREIHTTNKNISVILNSYLILRFVSALLAVLTIVIDFALFAPYVSPLVILSAISAILLCLAHISTVRYFKGVCSLLRYDCDKT